MKTREISIDPEAAPSLSEDPEWVVGTGKDRVEDSKEVEDYRERLKNEEMKTLGSTLFNECDISRAAQRENLLQRADAFIRVSL